MIDKVAVIGLGSIGKRHLANLRRLFPNTKILGISSRGQLPESVENTDLVDTSIDSVLDFNPQFAIIASPATLHFQHSIPLIEQNIPLLIEKPITADADQANLLVKRIKEKDISANVAYCLRYLPAAQTVKLMIENAMLGNIYNITAYVGSYLPSWRKEINYQASVSVSKALGGGVLLELSHELDYLHWFFGELHFNHAFLRNTKELSLEVEELADLVLTTTSGAICNLHMNFNQKNAERYCYIIGEKGQIHWNLIDNTVHLITEAGRVLYFSDPKWDRNSMYISMLEDFSDNLDSGQYFMPQLNQATATVALIEQIKAHATWGVTQ